MTISSHDHILVCSLGDYLGPSLTILDLYAYSTRLPPTPTSTVPILYLFLQTSPILVDHLGNFDWQIGAPNRWIKGF